MLKKIGLAAVVAATVLATSGAAMAQHRGWHGHGGYHGGGGWGWGPGIVGGLALGALAASGGGYYGYGPGYDYGYGDGYAYGYGCTREVWFDRFGGRHVRRICD